MDESEIYKYREKKKNGGFVWLTLMEKRKREEGQNSVTDNFVSQHTLLFQLQISHIFISIILYQFPTYLFQ